MVALLVEQRLLRALHQAPSASCSDEDKALMMSCNRAYQHFQLQCIRRSESVMDGQSVPETSCLSSLNILSVCLWEIGSFLLMTGMCSMWVFML